jgi:ATPase family associated with various cellular activities (AAA)
MSTDWGEIGRALRTAPDGPSAPDPAQRLSGENQNPMLGPMSTEGVASAVSGEHGAGWSLLELPATWDQLVLPAASCDLLRAISGDVRFRGRDGDTEMRPSRRRLMFAGERGTGKLLAARVLATDLGLALVKVELGTLLAGPRSADEQRLGAVFDSPELLGAIVYLADAGAWFGERSGGAAARDAGSDPEQAALLERIDAHHGPVIFAANLGIASPAVIERLDDTVEFPFPDERGRREIWSLFAPPGGALDDRALDLLAGPFQLTGGAIRRCCVSARSAAAAEGTPVELRHLVAAIEREYRGRVLGARAREALERFHGRTWSSGPAAPPAAPEHRATPVAAGVPARAPRARPVPPPARAGRARPARLGLALGIAAALAAGVVGFLLAHGSHSSPSGPPALSQQFSAGVLSVDAPADWQPGASSVAGLEDELAITPPQGAGTIVLGRTTAAPTTLPPGLLAELSRAPSAAVVTLAGTHFYRYLGLDPRDGSGPLSVYMLPTTLGTVVAECLERGATASFASTCERIVSTLRLSSGSVLGIGPSASYATGLDRVMAVLTKRVAEATGRLRAARTPVDQAKAANGAAAAYSSAVSAVGALTPGVAAADNQAVQSALRSIAAGYEQLRHAALHDDATGFAAAQRTIATGERGLQTAIAQLAKLGYSVS